ncbi:hypothetical protein WP12_04200 [Sphingomonas sp. SRS2]|nr:hypothetical protein WP12_04200 [Sphingomonas sp. SRS2]
MSRRAAAFPYTASRKAELILDDREITVIRTLATGLFPRFVHKRLGMTAVGPVDAMLLTTGVALAVRRDRPLLGLALLTIGGYRAWRTAQSERCPACGAS